MIIIYGYLHLISLTSSYYQDYIIFKDLMQLDKIFEK